ncbi:MAG: mechanosensitive ion channel domain-containing protein [Methanomassiliicoccales archaeon]
MQNTMAGIPIFLGRPILLEEYVELGGLPAAGVGRVNDITPTRTVLRNPDGRIVYISNLHIITSKLINCTRLGFVQTSVNDPRIPPAVAPEEEDQVSRTFDLPQLRRLLEKRPDMNSFTPSTIITGISASTLTVEVRFWIREVARREEIVDDLLESLMDRLEEKGLRLAE